MGEGCRQSHDSCCVLIRLGKAWKAQTVAEGISGSHSVRGLGLVPSVLLLYLRCEDVSMGVGGVGGGLSEERSGKQLHCLVMSACICVHACVRAWCEKRQLHFYCLPPLPPPPLLQLCSVEMQKAFCGTLLCHSLQTYFPGRAVMQKTEGEKTSIFICRSAV